MGAVGCTFFAMGLEWVAMRSSGWVFEIRKRWYVGLLVRTPLGSLAVFTATIVGLWLLAADVNLVRFISVTARVEDGTLRGSAPLEALESVGRDGEVLWRPTDGQGPPRTAQLVEWRATDGEWAQFVARIPDPELGTTGDVSIDFPSGIETIAQRLSKRVLGRVVER